MTKKHLAQLLLVSVVIIYTAGFIWQEAKPAHQNLLENVFLQDITATKFTQSGDIAYLLTASSIKQQSPAKYIITAPSLTRQNPAWELTAASAFWDTNSITLKNSVKLSLANKHLATTDLLNINLEDNTASTPSEVAFYNDNTAITALGMELDLSQENINLNHNITGKTMPK